MDGSGIILALTASTMLVVTPATPRAESLPAKPEDYCTRVRERARSEAALLFGPRIGVQAIRFPPASSNDISSWDASERQIQVRSYLDYSLTNAMVGSLTLDRASAECRRRQFAQPVENAIRVASDQGRKEALLKQAAFLADKAADITRLECEAERRLQQQVSTLADLTEIRLLVFGLRQMQFEAEDALAHIEATSVAAPTAPVSELAEQYDRATMDAERTASRMREVASWSVSVRGGIAATLASSSLDWFGAVEVSYNLGGLVRSKAEHAYLVARSQELESSPTELLSAARSFDRTLAQSPDRLRREGLLVEEQARALSRDAVVLDGADTPRQPQAVAVLTLRRLAVDARLIYLRELAERRRAWEAYHEP